MKSYFDINQAIGVESDEAVIALLRQLPEEVCWKGALERLYDHQFHRSVFEEYSLRDGELLLKKIIESDNVILNEYIFDQISKRTYAALSFISLLAKLRSEKSLMALTKKISTNDSLKGLRDDVSKKLAQYLIQDNQIELADKLLRDHIIYLEDFVHALMKNKDWKLIFEKYKKEFDLSEILKDGYLLEVAVETNNKEAVLRLLEAGLKEIIQFTNQKHARFSYPDYFQTTLMSTACYKGDYDIVIYLVSKYRQYSIEIPENILFSAVQGDSIPITKLFVSLGFVLPADSLHHARSPEMIDYLVSQGMDVNCMDVRGKKPMEAAVNFGSVETLLKKRDAFLKHGAVFAPERYQFEDCLTWDFKDRSDSRLIDYFIESGVALNEKEKEKGRMLKSAFSFKKSPEIVLKLYQFYVNQDKENFYSYDLLLSYAFTYGASRSYVYDELIKDLIHKIGSSLMSTKTLLDGISAGYFQYLKPYLKLTEEHIAVLPKLLEVACANHDTEAILYLFSTYQDEIKSNINLYLDAINTTNNGFAIKFFIKTFIFDMNNTSIIFPEVLSDAITHQNKILVKFLIENRVNPDIKVPVKSSHDFKEIHILEQAVIVGDVDIIEMILKTGINIKPLSQKLFSSAEGNKNLIELLLSYGAEPVFAIKMAVRNDDISYVKALLQRYPQSLGVLSNLLLSAASSQAVQCSHYFLEMKDINVNIVDPGGCNAMSYLARFADQTLLEKAYQKGIHIDRVISFEGGVLQIAFRHRNAAAIQFFKNKGINPAISAGTGFPNYTILDWVIQDSDLSKDKMIPYFKMAEEFGYAFFGNENQPGARSLNKIFEKLTNIEEINESDEDIVLENMSYLFERGLSSSTQLSDISINGSKFTGTVFDFACTIRNVHLKFILKLLFIRYDQNLKSISGIFRNATVWPRMSYMIAMMQFIKDKKYQKAITHKNNFLGECKPSRFCEDYFFESVMGDRKFDQESELISGFCENRFNDYFNQRVLFASNWHEDIVRRMAPKESTAISDEEQHAFSSLMQSLSGSEKFSDLLPRNCYLLANLYMTVVEMSFCAKQVILKQLLLNADSDILREKEIIQRLKEEVYSAASEFKSTLDAILHAPTEIFTPENRSEMLLFSFDNQPDRAIRSAGFDFLLKHEQYADKESNSWLVACLKKIRKTNLDLVFKEVDDAKNMDEKKKMLTDASRMKLFSSVKSKKPGKETTRAAEKIQKKIDSLKK